MLQIKSNKIRNQYWYYKKQTVIENYVLDETNKEKL